MSHNIPQMSFHYTTPKQQKREIDLTSDCSPKSAKAKTSKAQISFISHDFPTTHRRNIMLGGMDSNLDRADLLAACIEILQHSPTGAALYKDAMNAGWSIEFCALDKHDFHIDVPAKLLLLSDDNTAIEPLTLNLTRALRDVWQEKRNGAFEDSYGLEDVLMLERVRHADCETITVLVAWELRTENHENIWQYAIESDIGDMALTFSSAVDRHPSTFFNGKALGATFCRWYGDIDRVNECDHATLEYMDYILEDLQGRSVSKKLTPVGVEVLSCMPDRTAYLQGQGTEILRNPDFAGLQDPINQSHFFHVMHDSKIVMVGDVPFRDGDLARKIFPDEFSSDQPFS